MAFAATGLAWLRAFPLPWILFMALGGLTLVSILAHQVKLVFDRLLEAELRARIADLEKQLANANNRNATTARIHRDQMDAQAEIASALREQTWANRPPER